LKITLLFLLINLQLYFAQSDSAKSINNDLNQISGTWIIDLKPMPESEPYLIEFVLELIDSNTFKGIFYETEFENGKLNTNWEKFYFAFSTYDKNNSYFHSGRIEDDNIYGITYSPEREFTMPWTGIKREE